MASDKVEDVDGSLGGLDRLNINKSKLTFFSFIDRYDPKSMNINNLKS